MLRENAENVAFTFKGNSSTKKKRDGKMKEDLVHPNEDLCSGHCRKK
jgi:hypothetical protein